MFPSDNNSDHENSPLEPLLLFHHPLSDLHHHQNPITPKQDDDDHDPPFFSNFPSPFFDEHESPLNQILPHHHLHNPAMVAPADHETEANSSLIITKKETAKRGLNEKAADDDDNDGRRASKRQNPGVVSRKRSGKKDRHSKICTAQGIRDRRMRLSLQIARKFFDLQDMLGYDKASSTIEWLFSKSKKAIRELMITKAAKDNNNNFNFNFNFSVSNGKSESFLSECEVVSGVLHDQVSSNKDDDHQLGYHDILPNNAEKKLRKIGRKPNYNLRESREKARARAKWRTIEKMMIKRRLDSANYSASPNYNNNQNDDHDVQKLGFLNEGVIDHHHHDVGTIEKLLGNCIHPNSTAFMGFLGNWELLSNIERLNSATNDQGSSMAGNNSNVSVNNYSGASTSDFPLFRQ